MAATFWPMPSLCFFLSLSLFCMREYVTERKQR
uniref:Uncharacterized protein n=1 Tax=Anguilla anguilla TaxID=7936 RepID=A0A0E9QE08_ANGAN